MANTLITPYLPIYSSTSQEKDAAVRAANVLDSNVSAVLGGSNPALQPDEEWPRCGVCGRHLIPYIQINVSSPHTPEAFRQKVTAEAEPGHTPILQVLICAEDENVACFDQNVVSDPDGTSWIVRVVHLNDSISSSDAARCAETRSQMEAEKAFFLPERVISGWAAANPEVEHEEVNFDVDEDIYAQHTPAQGLKLLGWAIRGKFYTSKESCPNAPREDDESSPLCTFRCLLQLGTWAEYDEEKEEQPETPVLTVGNTWINQCERHPEVLAMAIGGDW